MISAIPRSILVLCSQVPFTRGGAEVLTDGLVRELRSRNFEVDVVGLPFSAQPKSQLLRNIALWRGLPLSNFAGRDVDMVICTKFPTYAVHHPRKVLWLIHQHRQMYDLYGTRFGDFSADSEDEALRQLVMDADRQMLLECEKRFTISGNVTKRLSRYLGLESEVLEPPLPLGDRYRQSDSTQPYLLSVGRLCSIKRVDLIIKALPQIDERISLKIVGSADEPQFQDYLESEVQKHQLWHRVSFLGRVADEELLTLFAEATATVYTPFDEDYGFVTLEALQSGTPVITTVDSGAVLSFVQHEQNGLVAEPTESGLAAAVNRLVQDEQLSEKIRANARQRRERSTWDMVIDKLTSPATAVDHRSPAIENG